MRTLIKIAVVVFGVVSIGEANADLENVVKEMRMEMKKTQKEMLDLKTRISQLESNDEELEREVSILKDPPFLHACGSQYGGKSITSQTIPFNKMLYSSTNTEGGGLDISTGIFSSPFPGAYTVTWSLMADVDAGDAPVKVYLRMNGQYVYESYHMAEYSGTSGEVHDQGGRTLVVHLGIGDTLNLYCQDCSAGIVYTTFCVSLTTPDIL